MHVGLTSAPRVINAHSFYSHQCSRWDFPATKMAVHLDPLLSRTIGGTFGPCHLLQQTVQDGNVLLSKPNCLTNLDILTSGCSNCNFCTFLLHHKPRELCLVCTNLIQHDMEYN